MAKLREGDPWMPGFLYGALLPPLSLNLLVSDTHRSAAFYRDVLEAEVHYVAQQIPIAVRQLRADAPAAP